LYVKENNFFLWKTTMLYTIKNYIAKMGIILVLKIFVIPAFTCGVWIFIAAFYIQCAVTTHSLQKTLYLQEYETEEISYRLKEILLLCQSHTKCTEECAMVRCLCFLKIHNKILTLKVVVLGSGVF
jgi:hypothetical protein